MAESSTSQGLDQNTQELTFTNLTHGYVFMPTDEEISDYSQRKAFGI